jgi:hypothetical protein
MFSVNDIQMLEVLIDYVFVMFGGWVFHQTVGGPMGTNWTASPLLADLSLYSFEADVMLELLKKNEKKIARPFEIHIPLCR